MLKIKKAFLLGALIYLQLQLVSCNAPIKIGLMVDLTGRASEIGTSGRNGAEIAVMEINQSGGINGRKISLVIKDDRGLPDEATKVDKELLNEDILLGIGHFASGTGIAGLKIFSDAGKLMISPTMSTESLTAINDYFIRTIDSNRKQGEVLADAAINLSKNSTIAVMYEKNNIPYTQEVHRYFKQSFEKSGGKIVLEESFESSSNVDFEDIANKLLESGANGALIVAGGLDLAVLTQKIRQKNSNMDIYSGMWAMTSDLIKNGGKAVEGIFLPGVYDKNNKDAKFVTFKNKYFEKYGEEPTFASIYSYEAIYIVFQALKECRNKYDTESIKKNILGLKAFKGVHDEFTINNFGDTDRGYFLFQVKNAEFARVK